MSAGFGRMRLTDKIVLLLFDVCLTVAPHVVKRQVLDLSEQSKIATAYHRMPSNLSRIFRAQTGTSSNYGK
jgi:hypothetical protein